MINPAYFSMPFYSLLHWIHSVFVWQESSPTAQCFNETSDNKKWASLCMLSSAVCLQSMNHVKEWHIVGCWHVNTTEEKQTNTALWKKKGTYRHKKRRQHDVQLQHRGQKKWRHIINAGGEQRTTGEGGVSIMTHQREYCLLPCSD